MLTRKSARLADPAALRQKLLSPRSIALIGASDDPAKNAARPLNFLRRGGYAGTVYPINPRRTTVLGERAWPSLDALPEVPDHAYVLLPTEAVVDAVAQCGKAGVPLATVLADGFATAGGIGAARSAQLKKVSDETGVRVIGPSSLGVIDFRARLMLTANAAFGEPDWPVGRVFAASHSGSIIGALAARGKARGIGFAALVSAGLEVDLGIGEICAATLDDPGIDGYLLFLETIRQADALRRFALAAAERGRPVVAYKLGRSVEARELAVTHSGALAGEDDVADAFFAACGIARVDTFEGLLEVLPLLRRVSPRARQRAPSVGVVTTTGGAAAMVVDRLALRGIEVAAPSQNIGTACGSRCCGRARTHRRSHARGRPLRNHEGRARHAARRARVRPGRGGGRLLGPFEPQSGGAADRRLRAGRAAARRLHRAGCAGGFCLAHRRRRAQLPFAGVLRRRRGGGAHTARTDIMVARAAGRAGKPRALDELAAYALLDRVGVPRAPAVALDAKLAAPPALPFAYPIAAKVLAADIAHKSDVGGVALDIADGPALVRAVAQIREKVCRGRPGAAIERVLVQPMVADIGEVLIAYRVEPEVGPLVMLAMGGVLTEIYRDRVLRLAPVDLATAREMIAQLKGVAALSGFRGKPAGDLDALAQAIVALSQLASDPTIIEAEVNPLIVREKGQGVMAVDALVLRVEQTKVGDAS